MKMFLRILSACILVLMLSSLALPIFAEESDFVDEPQIETGYNRGYEGGKNGDGKLYAHGLDISVWQGDSFNFEAARAAGAEYFLVEQDNASKLPDTLGQVERSIRYITEKL